jgi:peptide/nickel transport system permease protein
MSEGRETLVLEGGRSSAAPETAQFGPRDPATRSTTITENAAASRRSKLRLLLRMPLPFAAAVILAALLIAAIFVAPFVAEAANRQNLMFRFFAPFQLRGGVLYILGGDRLGRSMLAELAVGSRTSFSVAGAAVCLSATIGFAVGMVIGFFGGWLDAFVMRLGDIIVTLPSLLMALAFLFVLGPSAGNLVVVLAVARLPVYMRVARAHALSIREWAFVESSQAIGAGPWRIIWRDLRPSITPSIMTLAMLELGNTMLAIAGLSFLGVGLQRPSVDWGTMVAEGRQYIQTAWWLTVFPGLAVMVTALCANILSNWLRAVDDPLQSSPLFATIGR